MPYRTPPAGELVWPRVGTTLGTAAGTTAVVTALSYLMPPSYANTAVGVAFLAASWWLVLRHDTPVLRAYGVSLGGLTEPERIDGARLVREGARAIGWALGLAALIFPPFVLGYRWWWQPPGGYALVLPPDLLDQALGQLLVVALPEELFFRGYVQSALEARLAARRWRVLGAELGPGWLVAAAVFALGHVLTIPHPARLAVFFPALVFGWLRARTGGVGAGVLFHALCNLLTALLAEGYGLR